MRFFIDSKTNSAETNRDTRNALSDLSTQRNTDLILIGINNAELTFTLLAFITNYRKNNFIIFKSDSRSDKMLIPHCVEQFYPFGQVSLECFVFAPSQISLKVSLQGIYERKTSCYKYENL